MDDLCELLLYVGHTSSNSLEGLLKNKIMLLTALVLAGTVRCEGICC